MRSSPDLGRHEAPIARRARSSPDLTPEAPRARPPEPPSSSRSLEPAPVGRSPTASETTTEAFTFNSLPLEVQEQLFGILKATLEATLIPILTKQTDLENRLDVLREAEERAAVATATRLAAGPAPRRSVAPSHSVAPQSAEAKIEAKAPTQPAVRPSMVSTSYGLVMEAPAGARRPAIEEALANVGPIDVPDFGATRRAAGRILVALLLAGVVAALAATILSYT
jgi:hypothetical protein